MQTERKIPLWPVTAVTVTGTGNRFVLAHPSPPPKSASQQDKVSETRPWEVCSQVLVCSMNQNAPNT